VRPAYSRNARDFLPLRGALLALAATILLCWPGAGASTAATAGASSLRVLEISETENRTNGKIFAIAPGRGPYTCSGTVINTPSRSIVLTAGHCVFLNGQWGRRFVFVPAYDHGARPFGSFRGTAAYAMRQWEMLENPDYDVGAIEVKPNQLGTLGDVVGGREWTTGRSRFARYEIFGYPAGALAGESLRSCVTRGLGSDSNTNRLPGPPSLPGRCDMAGGASGGAWLLGGEVAGVTSYGYRRNRGRLYSPYFGPAVAAFLSSLP
jgi:V8-like Glu-specific endopeptidase